MVLKVDKRGKLVVPESSIQVACEQLLQLDGWRIFRLEQNYSERKRKVVGEAGAPDCLAIRYIKNGDRRLGCDPRGGQIYQPLTETMAIEWKSAKGKLSAAQRTWHEVERKRGALTLIAGVNFPASIEGFKEFYRGSGLNRGKI